MSFWSHRDPRAKTLAALALSFALAVAPVSRTLILLPGVLILLLTAGLDRRQVWKVIQATLLLWGLSFVANAFLMPGVRVGPEGLGWFRPTEEGIRAGFGHGARLACLAALRSVLPCRSKPCRACHANPRGSSLCPAEPCRSCRASRRPGMSCQGKPRLASPALPCEGLACLE